MLKYLLTLIFGFFFFLGNAQEDDCLCSEFQEFTRSIECLVTLVVDDAIKGWEQNYTGVCVVVPNVNDEFKEVKDYIITEYQRKHVNSGLQEDGRSCYVISKPYEDMTYNYQLIVLVSIDDNCYIDCTIKLLGDKNSSLGDKKKTFVYRSKGAFLNKQEIEKYCN